MHFDETTMLKYRYNEKTLLVYKNQQIEEKHPYGHTHTHS